MKNNINNWVEEWREMPTYNNSREQAPAVVVKINFLTVESFGEFKDKLKVLMNTDKPFDGMQRK